MYNSNDKVFSPSPSSSPCCSFDVLAKRVVNFFLCSRIGWQFIRLITHRHHHHCHCHIITILQHITSQICVSSRSLLSPNYEATRLKIRERMSKPVLFLNRQMSETFRLTISGNLLSPSVASVAPPLICHYERHIKDTALGQY